MSMPTQIFSVPVVLPDGSRLLGEFRIWEQAPDNQDAVLLQLRFEDMEFEASAEDGFFEALISIRKVIEPEGFRLGCYGCSRNVFPSPMIRSMGHGEMAYRLAMGKQASSDDLVSVFDKGSDVEPATWEEQEKYYRDWLMSLG